MSDEQKKDVEVTDQSAEESDKADEAPQSPPEQPADDAGTMPLDFATFVVSLGESAWVHLGLVPNPMTGEKKVERAAAKQTIDILGILEDKTKGNLNEEEEKLLSSLLYTLRMHYVQSGNAD